MSIPHHSTHLIVLYLISLFIIQLSISTPLLLLLIPTLALPTASVIVALIPSLDSVRSKKTAIINAGPNVFDIAIAMLETERLTTGYTWEVM